MKRTAFLWFLLGSSLLCVFVFRGGLWSASLLAPLDIPANLFPKYRFLDPQATGVPANQHIMDQIGYDLPMQHTVYESYHHGEIPWWDPYTYGGRPFLADAHISAVDPIRVLLYLVLPFESAYNWTLVTHFLVGGLGIFLLLQRCKFAPWICVLLALACEFAGCNALFFGHPWIQGAFIYYPFLWCLWNEAFEKGGLWRTAAASLPVAGILLAGNMQSHTYVVMFALGFCVGQSGMNLPRWRRSLSVVALSLFIGGCLAAPFVSAEVEFFLRNTRLIEHPPKSAWLAAGLASLSTVYPWMLGTFRTLDLSRFINHSGIGFHIYIGSVAAVLAVLGCGTTATPERRVLRRMAVTLVIIYGVIQSSLLQDYFYDRCAGLPTLGLTVLAAIGAEKLFAEAKAFRRLGTLVVGLAVTLFVTLNVVAFVIYPRVLPRIRRFVAARASRSVYGEEAQSLREFQVANLPNEISVRNPETVTAFAGLICVGWVLLSPGVRKNRFVQPALLIINLVPLLLFCERFIPRQPMEMWHRLLAGGPAQREVADVLGGTPLRLWEIAPNEQQQLFPYDMPHLYKVRTVHGYSAMQPKCLFWLPPEQHQQYLPQMADYIYESREPGLERGEFTKNPTPGLARFQWRTETTRAFGVEQVGLNEIHVHFDPGPPGTLLWTDTHFPGWKATLDGRPLVLSAEPPAFTTMEITKDTRELVLRYRPTALMPSIAASIAALAFVLASLVTRAGAPLPRTEIRGHG